MLRHQYVILGVLGLTVAARVYAAPLTLEDSFRAASSKSETLGQAENNVAIAEEQHSEAVGNLLPNLSGTASYTVADLPPDPIAREFFPRSQPEVRLTLKQPVFRGLREFAKLRQLSDLSRASQYGREETCQSLYVDVARGYYAVLATERDLKNFDDQLDLYRGRIDELRGRVRSGTSAESDLLSSETQQAGLRAQREAARGRVEEARERYAFLTGLAATTELAPVELKEPVAKPVDEYLKTLEQRPDILGAAQRNEAADENVAIARGAHLPSIDLTGNYYLKRPEGVLEDIKWDVRAELTLPIYSGGTIVSETRQAALERSSVELGLARMRRQAVQEVRTLHANYLAALAGIAALEKSLEISEKNYDLLKRDYRRGLTRNLDVLAALNASLEARRSLVRARFDAKSAWIELETAAGLRGGMEGKGAS